MLPGQPLDKGCDSCATCDWGWLRDMIDKADSLPFWAAAGAMLCPGTQVSSADTE